MNNDRSILIVEDNEDDVILIQRALRKAGVTAPIRIARSGDDAVDYLAAEGRFADEQGKALPAIVLLDLKLPGRSGLDVLAWIRAHATLATLPVVVFTTSAQRVDLERAYALGANSYLRKPTSIEDTVALLKTAGAYWLVHNQQPPALKRA